MNLSIAFYYLKIIKNKIILKYRVIFHVVSTSVENIHDFSLFFLHLFEYLTNYYSSSWKKITLLGHFRANILLLRKHTVLWRAAACRCVNSSMNWSRLRRADALSHRWRITLPSSSPAVVGQTRAEVTNIVRVWRKQDLTETKSSIFCLLGNMCSVYPCWFWRLYCVV